MTEGLTDRPSPPGGIFKGRALERSVRQSLTTRRDSAVKGHSKSYGALSSTERVQSASKSAKEGFRGGKQEFSSPKAMATPSVKAHCKLKRAY